MTIYLPIAEIPVNILVLILIGMAGGIMAGLFGIGGGFLITPILIFIGIPASVAVATSSNQIIASSVSGFLSYWYRRAVDIKMGLYLLLGGVFGSYIGVLIFAKLKSVGQIDITISLAYVFFLGTIGSMMFIESGKILLKRGLNNFNLTDEGFDEIGKKDRIINLWFLSFFAKLFSNLKKSAKKRELPLIVNFPKSNLQISVILPIAIGIFAGILVSIMGIGGGFIMIPAMIYLLKMPSNIVVGTSLFQIIFTTSIVTVLHAVNTQTVDIVLALILIIGGVFGAQIGTRLATKIKAENLRFLLAILILSLCARLAVGLFFEPKEIYSIERVSE
jgi:uncharacterized membrane protein YfcA